MTCQHRTWYERRIVRGKSLDRMEEIRNSLEKDGWTVPDWEEVDEIDDTIEGTVLVFEAWIERCSCETTKRRRAKA